MKTYARIDPAGIVAELLTTEADPATLFHPSLRWQDVSGMDVQVGWRAQDSGFSPPPAAASPTTVPDIAALQAQLAALASKIASLQSKS